MYKIFVKSLSTKKSKLSLVAVQASRAEETKLVVKSSVSGVFLLTSFIRKSREI
jgi:uncharacterized membrane protein YqhA